MNSNNNNSYDEFEDEELKFGSFPTDVTLFLCIVAFACCDDDNNNKNIYKKK
jgi:hypothetical protein